MQIIFSSPSSESPFGLHRNTWTYSVPILRKPFKDESGFCLALRYVSLKLRLLFKG